MNIAKITYRLPLVFDVLGADPEKLISPPLGFAELTDASHTSEAKGTQVTELTDEFIGLRFNLGMAVKFKINGSTARLKSNHFNFTYEPAGMNFECTLKRGRYSQLSISFTRQYLELLENYFPDLIKTIFSNAEAKTPFALSRMNLPIKDPLTTLIAKIYGTPWRGIVRDAYLNCKVFQTLLYCLETITKHTDKTSLRPAELQKIKIAGQYLVDHVSEHFSISMVADLVDMDKHKLRRAFKEYYHSTMAGFHFEKRMGKAISLLNETDLSIEQIAYKIGYKTASHFSNAFKKKYGFAPSLVRVKGGQASS
jgi:AraC-like DNA-binding protein